MFKGKTPLLIAGALGLLAALLAYQSIKHEQDKAWNGLKLKPVVVVNQDLVEGAVLDHANVARSEMPERFVTPSVVTPEQFEKVAGQRIMVPLQRGDLVLWNHFRNEDTFQRISAIINRPTRAISLRFSGARGVAGWVRPADHVDILGTFIDPKDGQMISVTLLENVITLATDRATDSIPVRGKKDRGYQTVTLSVLPEEAEMLTLAAELGKLRLTLRNPDTLGTLDNRSQTTLDYLLTGQHRKQMNERRKKLIRVLHPPGQSAGMTER